MDEIEALFITLGIKPDEASAAKSVDEMIQKIQSKLKSSIYGGKNGVITLPATIEGTYKNGREIENEIKDAYAAIYQKAKQMADKGVSLTLDDIKDFKNKVNKFSKMTAKKNANNVIANANNNLRQTLSDYQDFVNDLRKQVSIQKKQLTKSTPKKKTAYDDYLNKQEKYSKQAQGAGKKAELKKELEEVRNNKSLTKSSGNIRESSTNARLLNLSESSPYGSIGAYIEAKHRREEDKKSAASLVSYINKSMAKDAPKGKRTTREEQDRFMNSATLRKFGASLVDLGKGKEGVTPDTVYQNLVVALQQWASTGKDLESTFIAIKNMMEAPKSDNPQRRLGGTNGKPKGVGVNDEEAKATARTINRALDQIWNSPQLKQSLGFEKTDAELEKEINELLGSLDNNTEEVKETTKETKKMTDELKKVNRETKKSRNTKSGENSQHAKREQEILNNPNNDELVNTIKNTEGKISGKINETKTETMKQRTSDEKDYMQNIRESSAERAADTAEAQKNAAMLNIEERDVDTGFNTDAKAKELIDAVREQKEEDKFPTDKVTEVLSNLGQTSFGGDKCPCQTILEAISNNVKLIADKIGVQGTTDTPKNTLPAIIPPETTKALTTVINKSGLPDLYRYFKNGKWLTAGLVDHDKRKPTALHDATDWDKIYQKIKENTVEQERAEAIRSHTGVGSRDHIPMSNVTTSSLNRTLFDKIKDAFSKATAKSEADRILSMNAEQQARMRAERIDKFGLNRGRDLTDTGDIASVRRTKELFGWSYKSDKTNKELFQNIKMTPGVDIDTTEIMKSLNKVLSGSEMFKAQTGGVWRNILGSMTGYVGMPSLEKSRTEAEGLNQVMANVRNEVLKLVQEIQAKETSLHGMEQTGSATIVGGQITQDSSSSAKKLFADLEEQKGVLRAALAEVGAIDQVVGQTGGKVHDIIKNLGFVMPELMQNNTILQNINAGLDKNGKALKFQTRTAEVLNYSFQLMARHIGQMIKNWLMMLNPINLIKKAFQDFASYDVKWKRTMNVIKYNLRRIVRPMMEWIAQQIVNIIGLVNALMKGIGKVFGKNWDLFDQSAASAEQMREELEQAANVTAGFDELHDIGGESSSDPAMDLMGDIYTPQWDGLNKILEDIGETIGKIIKAVSNWTFWDWLKLVGAALAGYLVLKWLINLFSGGKNPLQTIAEGFKFLEKAVGWAILIAAFALFTKVLIEFIECIKTTSWEDIAKALTMLGGAFLELGLVMVALMGFAKLFKADFLTSLGLATIIASFSLLVYVLTEFLKVIKELTEDDIINGLAMLGGALLEITLVLITLGAVFTALVATGFGAIALALLALVLASVALVILALAQLVEAIKGAGDDIKLICEGIEGVIRTIGEVIMGIVTTVATAISTIITTIAEGITTVLTPILEFISGIIDKVVDLAKTIAKEIGKTIRDTVKTVGDVVIKIITSITEAIPKLSKAILDFVGGIGPAVETSVEAIIRSVTKLVNFIVSAIEYLVNLVIEGVNGIISAVNSLSQYVGITIPKVPEVSIPRFVPQYEQGTNYVPNDGLAYLHQGEAVVPKKYNQPYQQGMSNEERIYMQQIMATMRSLDNTMKQGIPINGEFKQRGSDLVAIVNKTKSQTGADLLSNVAYAR